MRIDPLSGAGNFYPPQEPQKSNEQIATEMRTWLDTLKDRGDITAHHHDELLKHLENHPDIDSMKHLASDLYSSLPATAPKPPVSNGH